MELYWDRVIPYLRKLRDGILREKPAISGELNEYLLALEKGVEALRADEQRPNGPASKTIRSQRAREYQSQLSASAGSVAVKYAERYKAAQSLVFETQEFLIFVEDSGLLLDQWEGIVLAMIGAGERGESALKQILKACEASPSTFRTVSTAS